MQPTSFRSHIWVELNLSINAAALSVFINSSQNTNMQKENLMSGDSGGAAEFNLWWDETNIKPGIFKNHAGLEDATLCKLYIF